jgi:hypothetical protein
LDPVPNTYAVLYCTALNCISSAVCAGGGIWWVYAWLQAFDEAARSQRQQQHYYPYYKYQEEEGDNEAATGDYGGSMSKKER